MATPTFDGNNLTSSAERDSATTPNVRLAMEVVPGVNGEYAHAHGFGGRNIFVQGMKQSTAKASGALAMAELKASIRTLQSLADGGTPANYVGTDGHTYQNCLLISYEPVGDIQVSPIDGGTCVAFVPIRAQVRQLYDGDDS